MAELKDPNTNPWYVLMTLHGEQTGPRIDRDLAEKNREAWNVWSMQAFGSSDQAAFQETVRWRKAGANQWHQVMDKIRVLHQEIMKLRNVGEFIYPGFPEVTSEIDLTELKFENLVDISSYVFVQPIDFYQSEFVLNLNARRAYFRETAKFQFCQFRGTAVLSEATFRGPAEFFNTVFRKGFYCTGARYESFANFAGADFEDVVEMGDVVFSGASHFVETNFKGGAGKKKAVVNLSDTIFDKPANFRRAKFLHHYPTSSGSVFHADSSFSAAAKYWPNTLSAEPLTAQEFCTKVRVILAKQGFAEEEHTFFRREMEFAGMTDPWGAGLPYRVFGWVSDYGHSILRPSVALAVLWLIAALIYTATYAWGAFDGGQPSNVLFGFGLSFANIFKFLGLQRAYFDPVFTQGLHPWLQFMGAFQTVVGFVLLFFFGLGLRTRFRMR